ncbi:TIR domain-containing protein [Actinoplanes sp. NPDC048796]|uniref:TIR domain-containing protein n=1 Tax=unclassified Actinoplanes TaxID=2626549 RepID=UPI0033F4F57D
MSESSRTSIGSVQTHNMTTGDYSRAGDDNYVTGPSGSDRKTDPDDVSRNVFVIYGRDDEARKVVFDYLLALRLNPLEWEELVAATRSTAPSLADVVRNAPRRARAVVALLTPDDVVHLHPALVGDGDTAAERRTGCQARPNVFLELGIALATHPSSTIVLQAGLMRETADLAGLNYVRLDDTPRWRHKVAERLQSAGCPVNWSGFSADPERSAQLAAFRRTAQGAPRPS